jgi:formate dehydrogenase
MGPDGRRLDDALAALDLLVAIDLVQRESHRHAHWLLPAAHWLERDELMIARGGLEETPFVQFARKAVDRPPEVREEWEMFVDLALAMRRPLFGKRGVNGMVRTSRWLARVTHRPGLAFNPSWIYRALVMAGRKVRWRDIQCHPHGFHYAERTFGHLRKAVCTPDRRIHVAPAPFVAETRRQLQMVEDTRSLVMISRRTSNTMNSWLMEVPGLQRGLTGETIEVNSDDALALGLRDDDVVRVSSQAASVEMRVVVSSAIRPGVVVTEQGWGSGVFDPAGAGPVERFGVNRNAVVCGDRLDPLSGTPALNGTRVVLVPVAALHHGDVRT